MTVIEDLDYLVVGAGAAGMAFVDALVDHGDATVGIVDRRAAPGGHWLDAYPFVRLHQASVFYGVASSVLGSGAQQREGPEAGLHERATGAEVRAYYADVLDGLVATGRVRLYGGCEYAGGGHFTELETGRAHEARPGCRIVDAHYLSPITPADRPPPFGVEPGVRVVPVADLPAAADDHDRFVVVGAGKTATDACVWLLGRGVDPGAIRWVRPREPWMLDRARVQPDPAVVLGMAADTMTAAARARDLDDLFVRLEDAGVMIRIDPTRRATMAKTPTLGRWELDALRSIEDVVRLGRVRSVGPTRMSLDHGEASVARGALVVDCAADGLRRPGTVPIWGDEAITLQPIRAGFPCFGAALAGYVEATRGDDDAAKNRLCPATPYSNSLAEWAAMTVLGARAAASFMAAPDIAAWSQGVALNPARIPPGYERGAALDQALATLEREAGPGRARLAELGGVAERGPART